MCSKSPIGIPAFLIVTFLVGFIGCLGVRVAGGLRSCVRASLSPGGSSCSDSSISCVLARRALGLYPPGLDPPGLSLRKAGFSLRSDPWLRMFFLEVSEMDSHDRRSGCGILPQVLSSIHTRCGRENGGASAASVWYASICETGVSMSQTMSGVEVR